MQTILVVDDDVEITTLLTDYLTRFGYAAYAACGAQTMRAQMAAQPIGLVVLDVMLPGTDGITLARELRERSRVPIIMLTARANPYDCVLGLEMGADDYMPKPFTPRELVARIRAVLRRSQPPPPAGTPAEPTDALMVGQLQFDRDARRVTIAGQPVDLSPREWLLLELLLSQRRKVITKEQIAQAWSTDVSESGGPSSLEVYIHRLRRKLEGSGVGIRTVRGLGYLLETQD